jgi:hypothetical protein
MTTQAPKLKTIKATTVEHKVDITLWSLAIGLVVTASILLAINWEAVGAVPVIHDMFDHMRTTK